ncbi:hypothetical protein B7494_g7643 [Chlorociboria aeruginascens]|nr:hypothetical protein B7494_g7643 [Chlorociboria aeruginascens]
MCHICRKVQALEAVDSKVTKSIYHLLAQLHQQVEPHLGDIWLWRLEKTTGLRNILTGLHKGIPIAALTALINDVDDSLDHIKKSMVDHPPLRSVGRLNTLPQKSVTPSESASIRIQKQIKLEWERKKSPRTSSTRDESIRDLKSTNTQKGVERRKQEAAQSEPRGSAIDPPKERMEQSICIVKDWFPRCVALVADNLGDDSASMVTIVDGGIMQRPKVKDGIWKRLGRVVGTMRRTSSVQVPPRRSTEKFDDCIYDKPPKEVLDERVHNEETRQASLKSTTSEEQAKKLSEEERLSLKESCRLLGLRRKQDEQKYMVRGGRSPGRSTPSSLEALIDGSTGRQSVENSFIASDIQKKVAVSPDKRVSYTNNLLSGPPSPTNLGSMLNSSTHIRGLSPIFGAITPVPTGHGPQSISTRSCESERAVISRKGKQNSRSRKEESPVPGQVSRELARQRDRLVSDRAYRGNARRQERRQQGFEKLPGRLASKEVSDWARSGERRQERVRPGERGLESELGGNLSPLDYTLERRRRRREQNRGLSRSDRYRHDERQRLWGHS